MTSDVPLYRRDPVAWQAYLAEGNATQPRKRVGADVVVRNRNGLLLLVNPSYKPDWDLPGGMAEANEPPHEAARRELVEELGLQVEIRRLLCVDWVSPHGPWDDSLMFVFDGGEITDHAAARLRATDGELSDFRFYSPDDAAQRLRPYVWRRVAAAVAALSDGHPRYLVDGHALGDPP